MFYCKICKCVIPLTMARVSGQGRLLPARLQQEKVAPPLVLFQLCRQKKRGAEGRPCKRDGLKMYRNKARGRYIYVISCLGASSEPEPSLLCKATALTGCSSAWRNTRPLNTYTEQPAALKISPDSALLEQPVLWSFLHNRVAHNGKYQALLCVPREQGLAAGKARAQRYPGIYQKLPLPCDQKQTGGLLSQASST